jgi:uncharacterized damage-inducible protein DinB
MKRLSLSLLVLTLAPPGQLLAQEHMHEQGEHEEHAHQEHHDAAMKSVSPLYERVRGYLVAAAEQMPEEHYDYRPTEEVRTFGQIVGHVANAQMAFCSGATGESPGVEENFEERTTKEGLVEALTMGFEFCDKAYAMDDMAAMEEVDFFGSTGTRLWVLNFNVAHDFEHYGNLVTYMRANGLVPPSSQGGM